MYMTRMGKVIAAGGLIVSGAILAAGAVWLRHQGLDRAGQWATVAGFFVSTVLGIAGLALGWLTFFSHSSKPEHQAPDRSRPGDGALDVRMKARASGRGRVYQAGRDQHLHDR